MRYIHFSNAAVAADIEQPVPPKAPRAPATPTQTYWALNTMRGRLGTYAAIRIQGDRMWVGVRTPTSVTWLTADQALSRSEAHAWFGRAGFGK